MTVSSPSKVAEQSTPRRSTRKAPGQLTTAQAAVLAYSEARHARGLAPLLSCGEGAATYAAAARERPASTPRRRAARVEDYVLGAATEVRPRVQGMQTHTHAAPQRRRLFKAEETPTARQPASVATTSRDALSDAGVAGADAPGEPRLLLSLRLDDTGSAVLCELLLVQACCVDALTAELAAGLSLRGAPAHYGGALAPEDAPPARLARLRAPALTHDVQRLSYLGNCAELRAYLATRGANTCSTAAVRRWLTTAPEAAGLADRLVAAHGVSSFAALQVDHIVSARFGGPDHPFNYFVLPRALNASFNSDGACCVSAFGRRRKCVVSSRGPRR